MKILSRYLLLKFIPPFCLSSLAFIVIVIITDLADQLSVFIDQNLATIFIYYLWYIPFITVFVLPMAMLMAILFSIGNLVQHREMIAMKVAGISFYRIVFPIQICALLISFGVLFFTDKIVPEANRRRGEVDIQKEHEKGLSRFLKVKSKVVLLDVKGQLLSVGKYHLEQKIGKKVMLDHLSTKTGLREKITAEKMKWQEGKWVFYNGYLRQFKEKREKSLSFKSRVLKELTVKPKDLVREIQSIEYMNNDELRKFIQRKARYGSETKREEVRLHLRFAFPFANFVIALFAIPLSSRTRNSGKATQFGLCLFISFVFYGFTQLGRAMGWNGLLSPFWGAWGANLIFLVIGSVLLVRTSK